MSCVVVWVTFPFFDRFLQPFVGELIYSRMNNNHDLGPDDINSDTLQTSIASGFPMALLEGLGVADKAAVMFCCCCTASMPLKRAITTAEDSRYLVCLWNLEWCCICLWVPEVYELQIFSAVFSIFNANWQHSTGRCCMPMEPRGI